MNEDKNVDKLFVAEKAMVGYVIEKLKTLEVTGYGNYEKLVECVSLLTNAMRNVIKTNEEGNKEGEVNDG